MNTLPAYIELDVHPLSGLLWTLALLFLWHCYRIGSDMPMPGHIHAGKLKSGSRRSMMSRGGGCGTTKFPLRSKLSRGDQMSPFISMKTENDEERGQDYLAPVLGQTLFPAQATSEARKRYTALQEYAKRYSWVGMGRIHKGLREQVLACTLRLNFLLKRSHLNNRVNQMCCSSVLFISETVLYWASSRVFALRLVGRVFHP